MQFDITMSWCQRVKEQAPLLDVARRFALVDAAAGTISRCPACGAMTRGSTDTRAPVGVTDDGKGWRCHRCGAGGDVIDLVSFASGAGRFRDAGQFERQSTEIWFEVYLRSLARSGPVVPPARTTVVATTPPAATKSRAGKPRPPQHEVDAFWAACNRLVPGDAAVDQQTLAFLATKGLSPWDIGRLDLARLSPLPPVPTPGWWPAAGHRWRLVVPTYEPDGTLVSVHARNVMGGRPKTIWPAGCRAAGLLLADPFGARFLRGELAAVDGVLVVEGLTDVLAASLWVKHSGRRMPVLGIVSGAPRAFAHIAWPTPVPCIVAPDPDQAGDAYAAEVRRALPAHIPAFRARLVPDGRPIGKLDFCSATDEQRELALARATLTVAAK